MKGAEMQFDPMQPSYFLNPPHHAIMGGHARCMIPERWSKWASTACWMWPRSTRFWTG